MAVNIQEQINLANSQLSTQGKKLMGNQMKKQRGIADLPQLALVILIGTLLAAVAYLVLPGIFAGFRASKITDAFSTSIPAIQTAYQNRTSYAGLTTAQVAQNRWVDSGMTEMAGGQPTGNLVTQWGTLTFLPVSNGTQAQATLNEVPSRECVKIATALGGDQYINVTINGATVKTGVMEMDLTAVGTQCNSSNASTIAFTFGRA